MVDESPARRRLRHELVRVRDLAGVSSRGMARHLGLNRGVVQRFDTGSGMLPVDRVAAWLDVCSVTGTERERILELAERAAGETRPWRELFGAAGHLQHGVRDREADAVAVRSFQPTVWPGLLQTPEYARLVLAAGYTTDVDGAVSARLARQRVLYERPTRFSWVISERVLRADLGSPEVLAAQLDRARSLSRLETVRIAVLPDSAPLLPWHNFGLWTPAEGDEYVTTELVHGTQEIVGPDDVQIYRELWERLDGAAREWPGPDRIAPPTRTGR